MQKSIDFVTSENPKVKLIKEETNQEINVKK